MAESIHKFAIKHDKFRVCDLVIILFTLFVIVFNLYSYRTLDFRDVIGKQYQSLTEAGVELVIKKRGIDSEYASVKIADSESVQNILSSFDSYEYRLNTEGLRLRKGLKFWELFSDGDYTYWIIFVNGLDEEIDDIFIKDQYIYTSDRFRGKRIYVVEQEGLDSQSDSLMEKIEKEFELAQ